MSDNKEVARLTRRVQAGPDGTIILTKLDGSVVTIDADDYRILSSVARKYAEAWSGGKP